MAHGLLQGFYNSLGNVYIWKVAAFLEVHLFMPLSMRACMHVTTHNLNKYHWTSIASLKLLLVVWKAEKTIWNLTNALNKMQYGKWNLTNAIMTNEIWQIQCNNWKTWCVKCNFKDKMQLMSCNVTNASWQM